MTDNELDTFDFNSLKLLKILGEELNTKRAAERLYITQSAVSKALKKLREQVDDPLFVRQGNQLVTTEKCQRLLVKTHRVMASLDQLYNNNDAFEPNTYNGNITIHINSALSRPLMSELFYRLHKEAPGATIVLRSWTQDSEAALKQGSVDLGINYYPLELSKDIVQTHIANPKLMLCCHQSNPLVSKAQVSLDDIAAYPIVLTQMPDFNRQQNRMLKAIRDKNYLLKVAVRTDKLDVCLDTIRQIPAVLPLNQLAKNALTDDLRLIDLSHIEEIEHTLIGLYSAYKTHETQYQLWLSNVVQDCVESLL